MLLGSLLARLARAKNNTLFRAAFSQPFKSQGFRWFSRVFEGLRRNSKKIFLDWFLMPLNPPRASRVRGAFTLT
jgi:hypothetical protein